MSTFRIELAAEPLERAGEGALDCNSRSCERIRAASARNKKSFKTNPIVPRLPNGAARCAFARPGAQRAPTENPQNAEFFRAKKRPSVALARNSGRDGGARGK